MVGPPVIPYRDPEYVVHCHRCGHEIALMRSPHTGRTVAKKHRTNSATGPDECVNCDDCAARRRAR